jgi:hypothetical protein
VSYWGLDSAVTYFTLTSELQDSTAQCIAVYALSGGGDHDWTLLRSAARGCTVSYSTTPAGSPAKIVAVAATTHDDEEEEEVRYSGWSRKWSFTVEERAALYIRALSDLIFCRTSVQSVSIPN